MCIRDRLYDTSISFVNARTLLYFLSISCFSRSSGFILSLPYVPIYHAKNRIAIQINAIAKIFFKNLLTFYDIACIFSLYKTQLREFWR